MEIAVDSSFYNNTDSFGRSFPLKILGKFTREKEKINFATIRHFHTLYSFRPKLSTNLSAREIIAKLL